MTKRSKSSRRWLDEHESDVYVKRIGNVGVFYRASKDKPRITLPGD